MRGIFAPSCTPSETRTRNLLLPRAQEITSSHLAAGIAHCQTVENEHPAALWNWPLRWSIGAATPVAAFGAWYDGGGGDASRVLQPCDWGAACNDKCPLFT